ncbi:MAG: Uma2 family endonuclease [Synechococcales cyanobacterium RM1_1_8]|nr:Uma2 family endonuclease [Synechococcales cyanobacterium RM1_1_8]
METSALILDFNNILVLSDEQFYQLCRRHPDIQFERSARGELIIMPPTGGVSGNRNFGLTGQLSRWVDDHPELGLGFDSSTCFKLPNGANRAPDAAWVRRDRWNALSPEAQEKFPPLAPDFVVELRSRTDDLKTLQVKMQEYIESGVRLGILLNPQDQTVELYQPGEAVQCLENPSTVDCGVVLPGFVLQVRSLLS